MRFAIPLALLFTSLVLDTKSTPDYPTVPGAKTADYIEKVNGVSFLMKSIPSGSFFMGCGELDEPCSNDEWIDRSADVRLILTELEAFYLAETETTWDLYQNCIDAGACRDNQEDGGDNGYGRGTRPIIEISWNDVTEEFLPWLNKKTGREYRLPTEAEWEYAARAGSTTRYPWGNEIDCSRARYGVVSDECGRQASTLPVKSYPPNAFGLYDMHGNVWEMTQDCWTDDDESSCVEFALRGGSWLNAPKNLRSAARFQHERGFRESGDGFRLARSLDP